ncbi:vignain-like [Bidens hawaiensis]|uniref:vignain-like n=1 Tax=Bidens hawaiensis TaxID=980011 RepID=UPI00404AA62C
MEISKSILLLLSLVLILGVADSFDYHEKELESEEGLQGMYERWRHHHKVTEKSPERFNVFKHNVHNIHRMNKQNLPYKLGINHFATMTVHEWRNTYANTMSSHMKSLPPRIDWRKHNAVTPVKAQGQCASCFAFASVGAIEGLNSIRTGQLIGLSEQQILDCDTSERTQACSGGLTCGVCDWIVENGGLATEACWLLTDGDNTAEIAVARRRYSNNIEQKQQQTPAGATAAAEAAGTRNCGGGRSSGDRKLQGAEVVVLAGVGVVVKFCHHAVTLDGREYTVRDDEQDLMKTVAGQPCAFMMDAGSDNFMFYKEGIYNGPCGYTLTHAMLLVGYDQDPDGTKYWIVKNSWGE